MVLIVADDWDIERCLRKNLALAERAGALLSEDLSVKCINGELSVEAPRDSTGKMLIGLPWDCAIPVELFELSLSDNDIVMSSHEAELTRQSVTCMDSLLELYNLTGKLVTHRRNSPWTFLASHTELWPHINRRLANDLVEMFNKFLTFRNTDNLTLDSFLHSRVYDFRATQDALPFPVLLPIIEFLNHHLQGAPIEFAGEPDDELSFTVKRSVAAPGTGDECFAFYGLYDSFDTWMSYGFIDETAPFARSIPMTIELPRLGTIQLANFVRVRAPEELPPAAADLYPFVPQLLARKGNDIEIGSLLLPGRWAPEALWRTLVFLINEMSPGHPQPRDLAMVAEEQVVAANQAYYANLLASLRSLQPTDSQQCLVRDNFMRMGNLQLARIQHYTGGAGG
jgi:hypothetical protein